MDDGEDQEADQEEKEQEVTQEPSPRLVYIEWVDSATQHGWFSLTDVRTDATLVVIQTVGWLLVDTDECKAIVAHIHKDIPENGMTRFAADPTTIPTVAIRKIVDLALPEVQG